MMQLLMNILSTAVSIYMFAIIIRIILTWFRGNVSAPDILCRITDPYLNWFRRFTFLRIGYLDLSPIAALGVLTVASQIFSLLARYGTITLGIILAILLQAVWSIVSFFIIFLIIVLVLRLIALLTNRNIYGTFWRVIDTISQPVLYRINRLLFKGRIVNFMTGILVSIGLLAVCYAVLRFLVSMLFGILARLPV
jgi:YggT family protein